MTTPYTPLATYQRHIASANRIILYKVIQEIQNQNSNEQPR